MADSEKIPVHIDEDLGQDSTEGADGSQSKPYKTVQFAYLQHTDQATYLAKRQDEGEDEPTYKPAAKAALKKAANYADAQRKKAGKEKELALRQAKENEDREKTLEEAKKIVLTEDETLPKAVKISLGEMDPQIVKPGSGDRPKDVDYASPDRGTRVRVFGRVHRERKQKDVLFITLRDGTGYMQCVLTGPLAKTYDAVTLTRESSMMITGEMWNVPPGARAPNSRELHADYFEIIGKAPGGDDAITNKVTAKGDAQTLLDMRHLVLRGETASSVMFVRDAVEFAFNAKYHELGYVKVSPPALVQTQVEGGSTLFEFDYYSEKSYLTQSSQLYLETAIPFAGNVYCIEKSFRAEKSLTRRHLSEYTHVEAELDFISFDDLLTHIEDLMCGVLSHVMGNPRIAAMIQDLNPDFQMPERPFKRMKYTDAIDWLNEHGIPNEEGQPHSFGDDIAEAAERRMTDIINRPIFLTHFPTEIKAFYMQRDPEDPRVTESVDCLMPGVGEIVGGSMRMYDNDELMAAYKREGIAPEPYYWYTDQRKYGTSPHGGYGLGLERFLAWLCKQHTVRDTCLYPRYMGRCKP
nr:asparagine--trna ligase, cytoplasmic [Quercus suber]